MTDSSRGLFGLVTAIIGATFCITAVTGSFSHWPIVLLGIGVGLWAATIITKSRAVRPSRSPTEICHKQETQT